MHVCLQISGAGMGGVSSVSDGDDVIVTGKRGRDRVLSVNDGGDVILTEKWGSFGWGVVSQ